MTSADLVTASVHASPSTAVVSFSLLTLSRGQQLVYAVDIDAIATLRFSRDAVLLAERNASVVSFLGDPVAAQMGYAGDNVFAVGTSIFAYSTCGQQTLQIQARNADGIDIPYADSASGSDFKVSAIGSKTLWSNVSETCKAPPDCGS